jgi:hypothetical protein
MQKKTLAIKRMVGKRRAEPALGFQTYISRNITESVCVRVEIDRAASLDAGSKIKANREEVTRENGIQ